MVKVRWRPGHRLGLRCGAYSDPQIPLAGLRGEGRRLENNGGPVKRGRGKERKREREIILFATALQAYRKGYRPI